MWAHVSQFPVHCTVKTRLPQPTICVKVVYGKHWSPIAQESTPFHKRTYVKRYIHFMKLCCGAVHLHPLLLSNTNSKHSAISRTACKAMMEAEHGLQKGDSGLGNHPVLGSMSGQSPGIWVLCQLMLSFHKLQSFTLTWFHICQMVPNVVQLRLVEVYLSIPSHHFWHLKRASSKVRCSCLEDRIEPAPHSSCCHASGSVGIRYVAGVDHTPSFSFSTYQELLHLMKLWTSLDHQPTSIFCSFWISGRFQDFWSFGSFQFFSATFKSLHCSNAIFG